MLCKTREIKVENQRTIYTLSPLWQRAVIGGSIWGALEITLGSALHNLMIPMAAGTLLAFLGVFTVSAVSAPSIERGFFWRAALISALLKSVSPSAVVLTPMVGIMLEGLLMEAGILFLGKNVFGLVLGGGFALLSVPLFKAVRLYMLYGQGIVDFFMNFIFQLTGNNHVVVTNALVYLVLFFYLFLGIVAASIGFGLGRKNSTLGLNQIELTIFGESNGKVDFRNYLLLLLHLIALVAYLIYASVMPNGAAILSGAVYVLLVVLFYDRPRRMLLKPFFIAPILAFSFIIPLFTTTLAYVPLYGSYIFTRAVFVVVALAAIGSELARPSFSHLFSRGIFGPVYHASCMAFNALPIYLNVFRPMNISASSIIKNIHGVIGNTRWSGNRPIVIITGDLGAGKSTYLEKLVSLVVKDTDLKFRGFIAKGIGESPLRNGYSLSLIPGGGEMPLCKRIGACGLPNKSFEFNDEVIKNVTAELISIKHDEILVIDEVGRMELYGEVWANLIEHHLQKTKNVLIFTVRHENLMHVVGRWNLNDAYVFDIKKISCEDAARNLKRLIFSYHLSSPR